MALDDKDNVLYEINNLKKYYPIYGGIFKKKVGEVKALDNVSVKVKKGETLGVVGESGCGKTTFGKTIMMLQEPTSGELIYSFQDGKKDVSKLNKEEVFKFRKNVQMIFQDPYSSLNPLKKIFDSFDEPLRIHGFKDKAERKAIMEEKLRLVNLQSEYLYRFPHEFSGGQRQRISIARALSIDPELIICDEPVSALDVSIQAQVLNLMKEIQQKMNLTYIFIAHDLSVVQYMSDRIVVMYLGKIVEVASKKDLYENTLHPYSQALLSAIPIPVLKKERDRIILEGDVPSPINKPKGCPFHTRCRHAMDICKEIEPELLPSNSSSNHEVACYLYGK